MGRRLPGELRGHLLLRAFAEDPSFYANVAFCTDLDAAPEEMAALYVLVPVPHLGHGVDWEREGGPFKERVYGLLEEKAGMEDIRQRVVFEKVRTPEDWKRDYNLEEGAAFGIGHRISQVGIFRPPLDSRSSDGLYIVGASTRPGTGVPLVTIGARLAAKRIGREVGW